MLSPLLGAIVVALGIAQEVDTTIAVQQGARLDVEDISGEVAVETWDRDAVRILAERPRRSSVEVRSSGSVVWVRPGSRRGPSALDVRITVPAWMPVRIAGPFTDASVTGTEADITVETVRGEIAVRGGAGRIFLNSVQGGIRVEGARGRIDASATNDDIVIRGFTGDIAAESVNGDIELGAIDSRSVRAETVNGDVAYGGRIREDGRYRLASHNGDVAIAIPEGIGATIGVATFSGEFHSEFPLQLERASAGKRFDFVIGSGRARIELESFNGEIRLRRPAARGAGSDGAR